MLAIEDKALDLIARIRAGEGPHFLVAETYRLTGHTGADTAAYRPSNEVESAKARDPLVQSSGWLAEAGLDAEAIAAIERTVREEIAAAVVAAEADAWPEPESAYDDVQDIGSARSERAHG